MSDAPKTDAPPPGKKSGFIVPISQTIQNLPSASAQVYTHVHPALVLSVFYLAFPYLVHDPVTALSWGVAPLAALQMAYCVTCLPPSRGSSTANSTPKNPKKKRIQFAKVPATPRSKAITAAISLFLTFSLATPFLTVILILFGAPFTTHFWHNLCTAAHMAVLGILPLFYVHGVNARMWREIAGAALPFDEVWGGTVGALVGAWLGAVPIPLDWDREWQKWPITIVTGVYLGWATFRLLGAYLLHGKRISFED